MEDEMEAKFRENEEQENCGLALFNVKFYNKAKYSLINGI